MPNFNIIIENIAPGLIDSNIGQCSTIKKDMRSEYNINEMAKQIKKKFNKQTNEAATRSNSSIEITTISKASSFVSTGQRSTVKELVKDQHQMHIQMPMILNWYQNLI
jgi:hypothetical protein